MSIANRKIEDSFKIGDIVECLKSTLFLDGTRHIKGSRYEINFETISYFNVNTKDYSLFSRPTLESEETILLKDAIKLIEDQLSVMKCKSERSLHNYLIKSQMKALQFALKKLGELK